MNKLKQVEKSLEEFDERHSKKIDGIIIRIYKAQDEDGYFYDIYDSETWDEDDVSVDGGLCTTTLENAIGMASDQAIELVNRSYKNPEQRLKVLMDKCYPKGEEAFEKASRRIDVLEDMLDIMNEH